MRMTRLLTAALGIATLLGAADSAAARNRDQRHAGHRPRTSTATYTTSARPPVRVLRTANARLPGDGRRFAQVSRRHGLMRGS